MLSLFLKIFLRPQTLAVDRKNITGISVGFSLRTLRFLFFARFAGKELRKILTELESINVY